MKDLKLVLDEIVTIGQEKQKQDREGELHIAGMLGAVQYYYATEKYLQDDLKYPQPPDFPLKDVKKVISSSFKGFGDYNSVSEKTGRSAKKVTRNAVDDLSELIILIMQVKWYFLKTSKRYALLRFKSIYEERMGLLLTELLSYIADRMKNS